MPTSIIRAARFLGRTGLIAGSLVIIAVSVLPGDELPSTDLSDKLLHTLAYAILMACVTVGFRAKSWPRLGLLLVALGAALEVAQGFVPGRTASLLDGLSNALGVVVVLMAASLFARLLPVAEEEF